MASPTTHAASTPAAFSLDVTRFPLVQLSLRGALLLPDARAMTAALDEQVFRRATKYKLLIDAVSLDVPTADVRKHFAEFSARNTAHTRRYCEGEAYVIPSPLVRGALTAIMWFTPFEYPHKVFARADEARAWLESVRP